MIAPKLFQTGRDKQTFWVECAVMMPVEPSPPALWPACSSYSEVAAWKEKNNKKSNVLVHYLSIRCKEMFSSHQFHLPPGWTWVTFTFRKWWKKKQKKTLNIILRPCYRWRCEHFTKKRTNLTRRQRCVGYCEQLLCVQVTAVSPVCRSFVGR